MKVKQLNSLYIYDDGQLQQKFMAIYKVNQKKNYEQEEHITVKKEKTAEWMKQTMFQDFQIMPII